MATDRDVPPAATIDVSGAAPTVASAPSLTVWLAGPAARALFTPEAQSADDLTRWRDIVNTRKREEWEVSRALLAHVRAEMGERGTVAAGSAGVTIAPTVGDAIGAAEGAHRHERVSARGNATGAAAPAAAGNSEAGAETFPSAGTSVQRVRAPSVAPCAPEGVALSLSHSGGYAAAAASRAAVRVGIDLECERPRDMARIARFAFTEREYAQLEALATAEERVERFYILWTLKEAFAKALSLPLLGSLRRCTFVEDGGAWRATIPTESAWTAHTLRASPVLVLSVVALLPKHVSHENFRVSAHEWPAPSATAWRALLTLHSDA